ncbi:endolytic transglycosylase MltG [Paenibacillus sp. y28]|uniref:endolytic transglycosylase MltG n=1 Tax=Paenibacillus sp. y28 TaxID=3129110 RepID=UPI0030167CA6
MLILLLIGIGLACAAVWYAAGALRPMPAGEGTEVTIAPGTSPRQIAAQLKQAHIIKNDFIFIAYLKYKQEGSRFQAGTYSFAPGETIDGLIDRLNRGDVVKEEMVRFTIPEGWTVDQIAAKLSEQGLAEKETFLALAADPARLDSKAAAAIPADSQIKRRLEGYLFPETYELKKGSTEQEFLERMLQETDLRLASLPAGWEDKLQAAGYSVHQMLTIASLVEREVVVDEERPVVAGVIWNRLAQKMPLQIDATVQYALGEQKERLLYADLEVASPYNTYKITGLPPGPIASPSLKSIEAAIFPAETRYLFYVTKKDGTKGHLFAETYEQHQANIAESNRMNKQSNP